MRCLFVMEDHPITPDAPGGGPVLMHSRLELLANSNVEIALVILCNPHHSFGFSEYVKSQPEMWNKVQSWCISHHVMQLSYMSVKSRLKRLLLALNNPTAYLFRTVNEKTIAAFREVIAEVKPDVIWVENLNPAVLAWRSTKTIPVIYSHHDWIWRIIKLDQGQKANTWHSKFRFWLLERTEKSLIRQVAGCVTASATEAAEVSNLNSKHVAYFPTAYVPTDLSKAETPAPPARIVHLGGMATVANRIGLERFLDVAWPGICGSLGTSPELWIVGSLTNAPDSLLGKLKQPGLISTGFVQDLSSVLRPFDIHIIPWEHNTGTRTRIPLILNYAQVVVSTRAAAACLPELVDGENCVLVDDLGRMGDEVVALLFDEPRRKRIGEAGRKTFLRHFTQEAIQPRFSRFINELRFDPAIQSRYNGRQTKQL